jgi:hypothetical protein
MTRQQMTRQQLKILTILIMVEEKKEIRMDKETIKQFHDRAVKVLYECKTIAVEMEAIWQKFADDHPEKGWSDDARERFCNFIKAELAMRDGRLPGAIDNLCEGPF